MSQGPSRTEAQTARLHERVVQLFEHDIRFNELLLITVHSLAPASLKFEMRDELIGHHHYGRLHGGVISTVLDAAAGLATLMAMADYHRGETADQIMERYGQMATLDLRIDYLRQGLGRHFFASASISRIGKRVASAQMQLVNDAGDVIATGASTFIVS